MLWKSKRARVVTVGLTVAAVGAATAGLASSAFAATSTTITSAPASASTDKTPAFAGTEDYDAANSVCPPVTVNIDGTDHAANVAQAGDPASCTWDYTSTALADGSHTYTVSDDTSAVFGSGTFEVDPDVPAVVTNNDGLVVGDTATVKVTPTSVDDQTFEQVNGGAWTDVSAAGYTHTYTLDHSGTWTVNYKAVDNGAESSVVSATWTVADAPAPSPSPTDTSSPAPTDTSSPSPAPTDTSSPAPTPGVANLTVTPPTFELPNNSTTATNLTFGVQVDAGATAEWSLDTSYWSAVNGGSVNLDFGLGTHTLYFRATDTSGNTNATSVTFTVVSSAPTASPSPTDSSSPTPTGGATVGVANLTITEPTWELPNKSTTATTLTFGVGVDSGALAQYSTNGSFWTNVDGTSVTGTFAVGTQTIYFRVTDASGNQNSASVTFTVVDNSTASPSPSPSDSTSTSPAPTDSPSASPAPSDTSSPSPSQSSTASPAPSDTPSATASPIPSDSTSSTPTDSTSPTPDPSAPAVVEVVAPKTEQAAPGGTITVTYAGFTPGETVQVWVHSTPILLFTAVADANGSVTATVTLPAGLELGSHQVILKGLTSGVEFVTPVTLAATTPTTTLPQSGANVARLLVLSIVLFGAGGAVLAYRRRSGRAQG